MAPIRFMVEETSLRVSRDLSSQTGRSGGQFGILSVLQESTLRSMRQQELADAMRWDRTRLSHQLTRMQGRGWITRKESDAGMTLVWRTEARPAGVAPRCSQRWARSPDSAYSIC